jgi:hypothetical protein
MAFEGSGREFNLNIKVSSDQRIDAGEEGADYSRQAT